MNGSLASEHDDPLELEALAHEARAEAERLFAKAKRARAVPSSRPVELPECHLSIADLCRELKTSKATVNRLCIEGLPHIRVGAQKRFELMSVREWLTTRSKTENPKPRVRRISTKELHTLGFERRSA